MALSASTGLIELVQDSTSLDKLYARPDYAGSLTKHFEQCYGPQGEPTFETARLNFIESCAGAAFVCYALGLKDRHNGNILLDCKGRLVHIDFGFCLGLATGGAFSLERAPFKLTRDHVALMGGSTSRGFERFVQAFADALVCARTVLDETSALIEIMQFKSSYPCFQGKADATAPFRKRHFPHLTEPQLRVKARSLVHQSLDSTGTYLYDVFQFKTNQVQY